MIPIRDNIPSRTFPIVTRALVAVNVAIFIYELSLGPGEVERLFNQLGIVPARVSHLDSFWPFLSSMFLHGGWMHVIGNMWTLWLFGDNVEDRMGHWRFLVFYLLTGLSAGVVHWLTNPGSNIPTVGASGAIAGVLGAYFVLFPRSRIMVMFPVLFYPFFFEVPAVIYLLFWFLTQVFGGAMSGVSPENVGGVAFWAHVGGFLAGMLLYRLFLLPDRTLPRWRDRDESEAGETWRR